MAERKHVLVPNPPRIACGFSLDTIKAKKTLCLVPAQAEHRNGRGVCAACWRALEARKGGA